MTEDELIRLTEIDGEKVIYIGKTSKAIHGVCARNIVSYEEGFIKYLFNDLINQSSPHLIVSLYKSSENYGWFNWSIPGFYGYWQKLNDESLKYFSKRSNIVNKYFK